MNIKDIFKILDKQQIVMLSTISLDGKYPQTRAMINLRYKCKCPTSSLRGYFDNNNRILFITNGKTEKIAQIKKNSAASLYTHDGGDNGLLLTGDIKIISDKNVKDAMWKDFLTLYYPDGRNGELYTVLEFIPKTFKHYKDEGLETISGKIES